MHFMFMRDGCSWTHTHGRPHTVVGTITCRKLPALYSTYGGVRTVKLDKRPDVLDFGRASMAADTFDSLLTVGTTEFPELLLTP